MSALQTHASLVELADRIVKLVAEKGGAINETEPLIDEVSKLLIVASGKNPPQWRYATCDIPTMDGNAILQLIKEMGKHGWEICSTIPHQAQFTALGGVQDAIFVIMKRSSEWDGHETGIPKDLVKRVNVDTVEIVGMMPEEAKGGWVLKRD